MAAHELRLFDPGARSETRSARYAEPSFRYLNESGRPEAERIRSRLEGWFTTFPRAGKLDVRNRFRSTDDAQHLGAFTELFFCELSRRLKRRVGLHPDLGHRATPDFVLKRLFRRSFYLECTTASNDDPRRIYVDQLLDMINGIVSTRFLVSVGVFDTPDRPLPLPAIRSRVGGWLGRLERGDAPNAGAGEIGDRLVFTEDNVRLRFEAIQVEPEVAGLPGTLAGATGPGRSYSPIGHVRHAVVKKARKYRHLDRPLVIAVNNRGLRSESAFMLQALFGGERISVQLEGPLKGQTITTNARDGALQPDRPRTGRVSAVIVAHGLSPWEMAKTTVILYVNPWSARAYPSALNRLSKFIPKNGVMEYHEGVVIQDLFGIPAGWPEVD